MIARRIPVLILAVIVFTAACAQQTGSPSVTGVSKPSPTPSPTPTPTHVFVIVMENRSYQQAMAQPYLASLAGQYGIATNYHAVARPSLPNYLALTSGSTWGIRDDAFHTLPAAGLADEFDSAGVSWRAYLEGFTGDCFQSPYPYALKHNPFAYYGGTCPAGVVAFDQLQTDLSSSMPRFAWIGPDMCHSGHDCSTAAAVEWLSTVVPQVIASQSWKTGGVLYITWDEASIGDLVPLIVVAPHLKAHTSNALLDHFALVGTIADQLGVARPGQSVGAPSVLKAFAPAP